MRLPDTEGWVNLRVSFLATVFIRGWECGMWVRQARLRVD